MSKEPISAPPPRNPIKKTYLRFIYSDVLPYQTIILEVPNRDAPKEIPDEKIYAYRFFDSNPLDLGFPDRASNVSGLTYPDGKVLSVDDVKKSIPNNRNLLLSMKDNNIAYVVQTRTGYFQPLNKDDTVTNNSKVIYPNDKTYPPAQRSV